MKGFMEEVLGLINQMSPFLLLGFLLAGMLHVFSLPTLMALSKLWWILTKAQQW